jgi:hypothetical protein
VAGAWGLYHLTRTGTCASGGPYVSARPCPPGTGGHIVSLIAGVFGVLIAGGIYAARGGDHRSGRIGFGIMLWTLGFLMLAGATLLGAYGPANTGGSKLGAVIMAGVFVPMALVPFLWAAFSGSGDDDPSSVRVGPAPAIRPHAFGAPPAARYPSVFVSTPGAQANGNGNDSLDQLEKLAKLHAEGALTDAEFAAAKAKVLSRS